MLIGQHFGKRKPRWNFFNSTLIFLLSHQNFRIKITLITAVIQMVLLSPIVYWSLQNYIFIEKNIPYQYRIHSYIESEKNWIILLYILSIICTAVLNYYIVAMIARSTIDYKTSLDAAEDQRPAS